MLQFLQYYTVPYVIFITPRPDLHREGYYEMAASVRLSVACLAT